MRLPLALLALLGCLAAFAWAAQLQDTNFAMTFRVAKDEFDRSLKETNELLEYAQEKKMSPNMVMFIRAARDKVDGALKDLEKRKIKEVEEAEKKKNSAPAPDTFTDKDISVKPLKGEGAKKCNIKKYSVSDLQELIGKGKLDTKKPFIVTGAITDHSELKKAFTSEKLMQNTEATLRYLSPVKAKERRTFDQQQNQVQDEEQLEYTPVTVEKYFVNCFNLRAKPDFRKLAGGDTEHCEQNVPATTFAMNTTQMKMEGIAGHLAYLQKLEPGRKDFVDRVDDLKGLVNEKSDLKASLQRASSRFYVFGPAGSGEQLRQDGMPFADALVHGKRRWFMMSPKDFQVLREKAKDVLEPASAFMFFEQQKEELEEEFGLGSKKMKFWECNQNPGEIIYIPGDTIMTSLNIQDSFSYKQHIAVSESAVVDRVNSNIWSPESGVIPSGYQFGVCWDNIDLANAGSKLSKQVNPMQGQIIQQIMAQYYGTTQSRNSLIINILAECSSIFQSDGIDASKTYCGQAWEQCHRQLDKNAKSLGASLPSWLSPKPPGKSGFGGKTEL